MSAYAPGTTCGMPPAEQARILSGSGTSATSSAKRDPALPSGAGRQHSAAPCEHVLDRSMTGRSRGDPRVDTKLASPPGRELSRGGAGPTGLTAHRGDVVRQRLHRNPTQPPDPDRRDLPLAGLFELEGGRATRSREWRGLRLNGPWPLDAGGA